MKSSYILILALLGVSALSLVSANFGGNGRPTIVIKANESGIVTLDAVNSALSHTWNIFQRTFKHSNKTFHQPVRPAPLSAFLDVDVIGLAAWKGVNVTLLSSTEFQVTLTGKPFFLPWVQYLASTTNGTNVTGIIIVSVSKSVWFKAATAEDVNAVVTSTFEHDFNKTTHNETNEWPNKNFTRPPPQPKPFFSHVQKNIAGNESTTTVTVNDINGIRNTSGFIKTATFGYTRANIATITSATATKWADATVTFNATVSNTSFTVTVNNPYPFNWVNVAVTGVNKDNTTAQGTVSVKITRPFGHHGW